MYRYYLIVIFGAPGILALLAWLIGDLSPWLAFLSAYGFTATAFCLGALAAIITRALPEKHFDPLSHRFRVHKWERKLYVKLGIRHWKDKIPETGALLGYLSKKKVADRGNNDYLLHFMTETCYAEAMHLACVFVGYLIIIPALFFDTVYLFYFAIPVAVIHGILHFLPVPVQRYVRPFLLHAYLHNKAKAETAVTAEKEPQTV